MSPTPPPPSSQCDNRNHREAVELTNALAVILGTAQIVERDAHRHADASLTERARRIREATQRLIRLLQAQQFRP